MPQNKAEFEDCDVAAATDAALLVVIDGKEHWIPKSQILEGSELEEVGDKGLLIIPQWLAEEKELV